MAIGAGPLYTNAVMGQNPSASDRETVRKAPSSTLLRRDCIALEESENRSRPESWSMHFDCTNQAPYSPPSDEQEGKMMTQTSLLHLPPENPSHDLAFFLRTTGPTAPHRRPSKLDRPQGGMKGGKSAWRFFRIRQRRSLGSSASSSAAAAVRGQFGDFEVGKSRTHSVSQSVSTDFRDEGGLLRDSEEHSMAKRVKQEVSSEGTKYLALQVPENPVILDSDVYVSVVDGHETESFDDGSVSRKDRPQWRAPTPAAKVACNLPFDAEGKDGVATRPSRLSVQLVTSTPQRQEPEPALSVADSEQSCMLERPTKRSFELLRGVLRHPSHTRTSTSLPLPELLVSHEISIGAESAPAKNFHLEQPTPRRFASHPLLLKRASSMIQSAYPRSISDSPAPPPKSPLRLRREPRTIEDVVVPDHERKATPTPAPRTAPSIMGVGDYTADTQMITPTVVTDCTGPIKRPRSRGKNSKFQNEREERTRARKLRDRPIASRTIDAIVNAPSALPRQRLKKARPHIHIPDFRSVSVARRASSSASSNASGKKVSEFPQPFPIPPLPYQMTSQDGEKSTYTPISHSASNRSAPENMSMSPVMLVAEEIPVPKRKPVPNTAKSIVKEGRSYAPRPRSASLPRNSTQRRSRQGTRTPTRPNSPNKDFQHDDAPPLPSPPPTRALPPPPPPLLAPQAPSSSDLRREKTAYASDIHHAPVSPLQELPPMAVGSKLAAKVPHVATQKQRKRVPYDTGANSEVYARLEAVEKHNVLLSAALNAVLRTNGELNGAIPIDVVENARMPMAWESRIARRSAATSGAPRGDGTALEMYMSTRNGSKNGR